jgi:hypothetical protein
MRIPRKLMYFHANGENNKLDDLGACPTCHNGAPKSLKLRHQILVTASSARTKQKFVIVCYSFNSVL